MGQLCGDEHSLLLDFVLFVEELHYFLEILVLVYFAEGLCCFFCC